MKKEFLFIFNDHGEIDIEIYHVYNIDDAFRFFVHRHDTEEIFNDSDTEWNNADITIDLMSTLYNLTVITIYEIKETLYQGED